MNAQQYATRRIKHVAIGRKINGYELSNGNIVLIGRAAQPIRCNRNPSAACDSCLTAETAHNHVSNGTPYSFAFSCDACLPQTILRVARHG